ncbi:MAG: sugar transferase, partial [Solirubrobacterales bacterium]
MNPPEVTPARPLPDARRASESASEFAGLAVSGHPDATRRSYLIHRLLLASDLFALAVAYGAMIGANALAGRTLVDADNLVAFGLTVPIWILLSSVLGLYHLYERRVDHTFADELIPVFLVTTVWAWFYLGVYSGLAQGVTELRGPGVLWATAIVAVLCARGLARHLAARRAWFRQPVMLIGQRDDVDRVLARIDRHPECGLDPAFVLRLELGRAALDRLDGRSAAPVAPPAAAAGWNAQPDQLAAWIRELGIDRVIIAGWSSGLGERTELIRALTSAVISVDVVAAEPEALLSTAELHHLEGLPILTIRPTAITKGSRVVKRCLDICVASFGLAVLAPLLAYIAIRIKLDSKGPALFSQQRAGLNGAPFKLFKFRTMVDGAEAMRPALVGPNGGAAPSLFKLREDPRVTKFGARLRRSSLDELPQLWNVLRGQMSLVGPRPDLIEQVANYEPADRRRLDVKPGITGWAQVLGRDEIPWEERFRLDAWYVDNWSLRLDARIVLMTFTQLGRPEPEPVEDTLNIER